MKQVRTLILLAAALAFGAQAAVITGSSTVKLIEIPDGNAAGLSRSITLVDADAGLVDSLTVTVTARHSWIGDLVATLSHGGRTIRLLDRPGLAAGATGIGDNSNLAVAFPLTFSAGADRSAELMGTRCGDNANVGGTHCAGNSFLPEDAFTPFIGGLASGDWVLNLSDREAGDFGSFKSWSLSVTTVMPPPVDTNDVPEPGGLALTAVALLAALGAGWRSRRRR